MMNHLSSVLQPREKPDPAKMLQLLETAVTDSADFIGRMSLADRVKNCIWEGQSEDGRKWEEACGEQPAPWEGASDQRVALARILCREEKLICTAAMVGGRMQAVPVDSTEDPATASAQAPLLKWLFSGPMRKEIRDEVDFLLDWRATYGHAVMGVEWRQTRRLREESLTADQLLQLAVDAGLAEAGMPGMAAMEEAAAAGQMPPEVGAAASVIATRTAEEMQAMLLDPEQTDRLVDLLDGLLNAEADDRLEVPRAELRRVAAALQKGEPGIYYRPWLRENRPRWRALLPWVDVFYPVNTTRLDEAEWIACVHWLSESRLRDRAALEDWDEAWLADVLKHPGNAYAGMLGGNRQWVLAGSAVQRGLSRDRMENSRMFQIVELHQLATAANGVPCVYRTVLHPAVPKRYAIHEPLAQQQGCYHFAEFRRQREDSRYLIDARGIPEEVLTHQNAIKAQHDARTNRTDLELMPPMAVPMNRAGGSFSLGPMAQIPTRRSGTIEWMKPPPVSLDSVAITRAEWDLVDTMFGRFSPNVPQPLIQLHQGKTATDFLTDLSGACQLTYEACQEYYSDADWQRVTGMPKPPPDPYGQDVMITFDVRNLDMEWLRAMMEAYTLFVVPNDSEGVIDRAEFVSYIFSAINPQVAQRIVKPKDAAAQSETEDELSQLAIIMSGEEPPQKPGQNYALRLQVLERALSRSMEINRKVNDNKQIAAVLEGRMEFFRNNLQQRENAIIGRTMAQPVMNAGGAA